MSSGKRNTRIMVVDDSAIVRSIIEKILVSDPQNQVCGFASSGTQAIELAQMTQPDIVILDIEMPDMDGITAIPRLLEKKPDLKILMCSTLSGRGATISIKAMALGAADCILKPSGASGFQSATEFHAALLRTVDALRESLGSALVTAGDVRGDNDAQIKLRPLPAGWSPRVIAIGSSTGGPKALLEIFAALPALPVPIVLTQHMPKGFTRAFSAHLAASCQLKCFEAENGMILMPGCVYIAPGGLHLGFEKKGNDVVVALNDGPVENFCRPAVNPMLRSLISCYGRGILCVMLTGMGEDGMLGAREVVAAGGAVIAQDRASSVVWGMPGAVSKAGVCSDVLPLNAIAPYLSATVRFTDQLKRQDVKS